MIQSEVERMVREGAAGSTCVPERVIKSESDDSWDVNLRCTKCGPLPPVMLFEQNDQEPIRGQVKNAVVKHEAQH